MNRPKTLFQESMIKNYLKVNSLTLNKKSFLKRRYPKIKRSNKNQIQVLEPTFYNLIIIIEVLTRLIWKLRDNQVNKNHSLNTYRNMDKEKKRIVRKKFDWSCI